MKLEIFHFLFPYILLKKSKTFLPAQSETPIQPNIYYFFRIARNPTTAS